MTERRDRQHDTTAAEDEASLAGAQRLRERLPGHPFALGFLAVCAAAGIFLLGTYVGETVHLAFDGDTMMVAVFGGTFGAILLVILAIGVLLDRRQRSRDANAAPLTDTQTARLRAYLQPASPLVRWYQPLAIAVFFALAVPGVLLLDTPWDGLWVLVVLIANPVARGLRAQGHVLTTRDLGFPIPAQSHWPSIANAALAATAGMAVAVLLWAEALDTNLATTVTGMLLLAVIIGGGLFVDRSQRQHLIGLLDDGRD